MGLTIRIGALLAGLLLYAGATAAPNTPIQTATPSLAGQLLVATPELEDPNFHQTIVYMVEHNTRGAQYH